MTEPQTSRRGFFKVGLASLTGLALAGCGEVSNGSWLMGLFGSVNRVTHTLQRAILGRNALAPEYAEADISDHFRANGSTDPADDDYKAMAADGFSSYALEVDGLVEKPSRFSLAELRAMPSRTQITRHDCVEGWSCIGKWTGVPLSHVLGLVGVKPEARYVLFHCFDTMDDGGLDGPTPFYGTIDLFDAAHPQTILAYDMNGEVLKVPYGAPLRLRLEQALGYKMTKYIKRIELVDSFAKIGDGQGGYWEDNGYDWYGGIEGSSLSWNGAPSKHSAPRPIAQIAADMRPDRPKATSASSTILGLGVAVGEDLRSCSAMSASLRVGRSAQAMA